jgi:hypothetical protein
MTDPIPRELERIVEEARGLIDEPDTNPEYERALVEIIIRCGTDMSHDADTNTVRDWLGLRSERTCPVCAERYDLDDGIDWQACPAHVDDVDPYSDKNREAAAQETRIDAERPPYVVVDNEPNFPDPTPPGTVLPVLGRFPTEDAAAAFIEKLPGYLTGRYGLDGPADD